MVTLYIKRILIIGFLFFNIIFLGCANNGHYISNDPRINLVTVTGTLVTTVAIGGETTGWSIELDLPLVIERMEFKLLEVDPCSSISFFENQKVEITGTLSKRYGIERKGYWVLLINKIQLITKEGIPF